MRGAATLAVRLWHMKRIDVGTSSKVAPARGHIVKRPRLTRLLDESSARIIALIAPAGYGKTTLARQWLEERRHTWYSATSASSDVAALSAGLARATGEVVPGAGTRVIQRLAATGAPVPTPDALADLLAEDLAQWPEDAWLAIDDYQFVLEGEGSERFVAELVARAPVRLLIASRQRPSWTTARRILYGEILEVGRSRLALTAAEAEVILPHRKPPEVADLVALAEGWPAVIGLASLASRAVTLERVLADHLYEYLADEVFRALTPGTQEALCELSVLPAFSADLIGELYGSRASNIAAEAEAAGFLARAGVGTYELHPLLRSFLETKLGERAGQVNVELASRIVALEISHERWDDAFALVEKFRAADLVDSVIDASLNPMLLRGRLETLSRWVEVGRRLTDSPLLDLADAELGFREGRYSDAQAVAELAVRRLPDNHPRMTSALNRLGSASYFRGDFRSAEPAFRRAERLAQTRSDRWDAIWGLINVSIETEDQDEVRAQVAKLESLSDFSPEEELRLAQARLGLAYWFVGFPGDLDMALASSALLNRARDPMARSGFLNALSYSFVLVAQYGDALAAAADLRKEAESYRLAFALPHALLTRARAEYGLREFTRARRTLNQALSLTRQQPDRFAAINAAATMARIHLALGRARDAVGQVAADFTRVPNRSTYAEYLAIRALALARCGESEAAREALEAAGRTSSVLEVRGLVEATKVILALQEGRQDANQRAIDCWRSLMATRCFDPIVCAYRSFPELLRVAWTAAPDLHARLTALLIQTNDRALAKEVGIPLPPKPCQPDQLSPREREVLELLGLGLSNREIGGRLFISEMTVKVHIRRIFEKLGVKSRTEAALLAAKERED